MLVTVILLGCSGGADPAYDTWGEKVDEFANSVCYAGVTCGFLDDNAAAECVRHTKFHMCELDYTCEIRVEFDLEQCLDDLASLNESGCVYLRFYGLVPQSCDVLWDNQPEPIL